MRKSKVWICIGTLFLICMILLAGMIETEGSPFVTAVVGTEEQTEELSCWYDTYTGTVYFFLPGYAQLDQIQLRTEHSGLYQIGEHRIEDGMDCGGFSLDVRYPIEAPEGALYSGKELMFVQSDGIGSLFLDVRSGNMTYLHEDKKHSEQGTLRLYDETGALAFSGTVDSVKGRGQSSWEEEKKSYNIQLTHEADLLNMGNAKNWVLQANSKDPTHLRNKLVFDTAAALGLDYTPQSQWIDLYLNGEYAGLYLLCEKIEIHPQRVDIPEEGSFLVSKDWQWRFEAEGDPFVMTKGETALEIRYADFSEEALLQRFQSLENALLAEDGVDPVTGKSWQALLDKDSWARKYLIEEIFGNTDGLTLSQFYYLDGSRADGRISAGPVWDYDLAMVSGHNLYHVNKPGVYGSSWMPALLEKTEFSDYVQEVYTAQFRPILQKLLDSGIAEYQQRISAAVAMDRYRWYVWGVEDSADVIGAYLHKRVALFDKIWVDKLPYIAVDCWFSNGTREIFILEAGSSLSQVDQTEGLGWYNRETDELIASDMPIYENVTVYQGPLVQQIQEVLPDPEPPVVQQETVPETVQAELAEEAASEEEEPLPLRRWLPIALFAGMLLCVMVLDMHLRIRENRRGKRKKEQQPVQ